MAATTSTWAQQRTEARSAETKTETLFHTYAQYASKTEIDPEATPEELSIEAQLNEILETRTTLLAALARTLDSEPSPSALKTTNLSRHREILTQHRSELARLKSQIAHARSRANLLSNVRSDISAYRSLQPGAAEADYMLDERRRVENSHSMADSVLSQAYAVNENFGLQRETLQGIQRRITGAAARVPGINGLMQRIGSKRRRDGFILGGFIAFCFLVMLWFW